MGPNIMPMEIRKSDKSKEAQKPEKIGLDSHKFYNKIVEVIAFGINVTVKCSHFYMRVLYQF